MKKSFISILAVAGILISGCALEEAPSSEGSIRAIMENDETRTSVTDEGKFTWSAGDQIWLGTTSGSVIGTLSTGAGTANATFSYGSFFGEMTGKAVYPYNSGHSVKGDVLDMVLPASYDLGTFLQNTNAALYGVNVDGTLKFNHLAGVMRFKFKNVPAGVNQFVITLDKKINGTFEADLTADYPVLETSATEVEAEKTVTFNFDALTQASDIMIYVPLPLGTYNSLGLALNNAEKSVWTYSNTVTNTIKRKKLILMPTVTLSGSIDGDLEGEETPADAVNLSENGTANSYIVSAAGSYKFTPTKGNSNESVGAVASAAILWESFGTNVTPNVGDLVKNVKYADGAISFETPSTFKEGNAVIAAKDASGNILWSWHIWLTDEPQGQEYYNNAGTMMDRNLGATSATPGDVGALGLLYQWGRKDPFLGSSSISSNNVAKSTITWPSSVKSDSSNGTIAYATSNPTTFITGNNSNDDWYYTGSSSTDNTRWTTSESSKSIYDPCPSGWRVPDGGSNGVWSTALGSSSSYYGTYDSANEGMNFSGKFGSASTIWYPASGWRDYGDGSLDLVAYNGDYWSASPNSLYAYYLGSDYAGYVYPSLNNSRAIGRAVRCVKEGSTSPTPSEPEIINLSENGTANSYIVSEAGSYKIVPTKGNSNESVGTISSVEVLWESLGPGNTQKGDLIKSVSYDGKIAFQTVDTFKEGNAVIAAKDASGNILWSWHIWFTDEPQGQEYYNNAGTMMDRDLGAYAPVSNGLLYQWGRKDPFLGGIYGVSEDKSTITWPSAVRSDASNGTIEYATANPTTFITCNQSNNDWYYTGDSSTDDTRWAESVKAKSIYDPCPAGWRVPDGEADGVWSKALGSPSEFNYEIYLYYYNFVGKLGSDTNILYPVSHFIDAEGNRVNGGISGCWSASSYYNKASSLVIIYSGNRVIPSDYTYRAYGFSVRCIKE